MKLGQIIVLGIVALVLATLIPVGCVYTSYTKAVRLDESVKSAWAQVENQLQRRFDLIPNLIETVKGVAGQEQEIFLGIAEARKSYFQAKSVNDKTQAANTFESALSRLLVLQEKYPELKSNEAFAKLQDQLEGTENRLSVERKTFNETVQALNTFRRMPLNTIGANMAGIGEGKYFEIEQAARATPKVDFSKGAGKE